jgi:hypothetical protein
MTPLLLTRGLMDAFEGSDKMQLAHQLKKVVDEGKCMVNVTMMRELFFKIFFFVT